jgi:hypothetical protein
MKPLLRLALYPLLRYYDITCNISDLLAGAIAPDPDTRLHFNLSSACEAFFHLLGVLLFAILPAVLWFFLVLYAWPIGNHVWAWALWPPFALCLLFGIVMLAWNPLYCWAFNCERFRSSPKEK